MKTRRNREINIFSVSFLDVLANTIGGLAFLLVLAVMLVGSIVFAPPEIMTERIPDAYHGVAYSTWLGAREGLGKFKWTLGEGECPEGLTLDARTGKLHGNPQLPPDAEDERDYEFEVICEVEAEAEEDVEKEDRRNLTVTVHREAPTPIEPVRIVTEMPLPTAYGGQPYPLTFAAEGGRAPYSWSTASPPQGLELSVSGRFTGNPSAVGEQAFEVTVAAADGTQDTREFTLDVAVRHPPPPPIPPVTVLTERVPEAVAEREYSLRLAAEGGIGPYTWSIVSGEPEWLAPSADARLFAGTPRLTDIGQSIVLWQVTDSRNETAQSDAITLEVLPPPGEEPPPLRLKTTSLPDARVGQPYNVAIAVEGGFPPYTWNLTGDLTQHGIEFLMAQGIFDGTPSAVGEVPVHVSVSDRSAQTVSADYTLAIHPATEPVRILTDEAAAGRVGRRYDLALSAVGGYPPYTWELVDGDLPPGVRFDSEVGRLEGTLGEAGTWHFEVDAADAEGRRAEQTARLRLLVFTSKGFRKLQITTRSLPTLLTGKPADVTMACEGGDPPYEWTTAGPLPEGLALEDSAIRGTPVKPGFYEVTLNLADASGEKASATYEMEVRRVVSWWIAVLLGVLLALAVIILLILARAYSKAKIQPLRITTEAIPNARASQYYEMQLACEGGAPPYEWRIVEGELPDGMVLSPEGVISGKPFEDLKVNQTKDVPFTVEVRDQRGETAQQAL